MLTRIPRWEFVTGMFVVVVLFWALVIWEFGLSHIILALGAITTLFLIFVFTGFPLFQIQDWWEGRKKFPEVCGD